VGEDPATGSAAGPLGVYLAEHGLLSPGAGLRVHQGEQVDRPSLLEVEVERDGRTWIAWVGGEVRHVGEGAFHL
jgi:trans-2,3-dihydro-3-hydroxyanthranilate isomerase